MAVTTRPDPTTPSVPDSDAPAGPWDDRADLSGYRAVHHALRTAARAMAAAAPSLHRTHIRRLEAFTRYWQGYAGEVLAHHTIEDDICFPALVARAPAAAVLIERTDAEHHELDDLMEATSAALAGIADGGDPADLAGVLERLADHMDHHLDFEDAEILPVFEQSFSAAEYEELDRAAMKHLGLGKQALFTVPFIAGSVSAEERSHLLGDAPLAFRALYRLSRGRHQRLADLALGVEADPGLVQGRY